MATSRRRRWATSLVIGSLITLFPVVVGDDLAKMILTAPGMFVVAVVWLGFDLHEPLNPIVNAILTGGYFGASILAWALLISVFWYRVERSPGSGAGNPSAPSPN